MPVAYVDAFDDVPPDAFAVFIVEALTTPLTPTDPDASNDNLIGEGPTSTPMLKDAPCP